MKNISANSLLILFLIQSHTILSQVNYLNGYILDTNNDTIYGLIDYQNWEMNPEVIRFKMTQNSEVFKYKPFEINGFSVLDEKYFSAYVETEISHYYNNNLDYNQEYVIQNDTVFLQVLFEGDKPLYYLNKKGKPNFYILHENKINLLLYKRYLTVSGFRMAKGEKNMYKNQLSYYLKDSKQINTKIESSEYTKSSLEKVFKFYYKSTGKNIEFNKEIEKLKLEYSIIGGTALSNLTFESQIFTYLTDANYEYSKDITAGIGFNLILPRNLNRLTFNTELFYYSYKINGSYHEYFSQTTYTDYLIEYGNTYLKLNNSFRYRYPLKKMFLFVNIGISNGFSLIETNNLSRERYQLGELTISNERVINKTRKHELSFNGGIGVNYKRFFIETRYESGNGVSDILSLKTTSKRFYLLLGFILNQS
jgi:hypothetical protein